ncbi:hypothetical protein LCI18_014002 [Fusarium solani-melongenae]|uniref:Uncharacterized protein n=1 Tax=Fusarium solani subsp. cucurbitae TaxID=2747967 RepID=A0ACD3ZPD8_FUSSC|nr:hypothetical protein LCI18_014002 [Fusarium solani-melongenae]
MLGYWRNEAATNETKTSDGWVKTGDVALFQGGKFWIVDRKKELIKVNGLQPGIIYYHGGAMVSGNAYSGILECTPYVEAFGSTLISVDYRLAPEHRGLALVEDCYAALLWAADNLKNLNIDPDELMMAGGSAGGGLAAATTLMSREIGGPKLCGQLLDCPMLDDRNSTISSHQFSDGVGYNSTNNIYAWRHVLGDRCL